MISIPENLRTVTARSKNEPINRSANPPSQINAKPKIWVRLPEHKNSDFLERILSRSRVLIIEGISGSGKDTFQKYLKTNLKGRDVYDYSEGEVLLSWNQLQIKDIFKLQVKFMKLFMSYVTEVISDDENAVFLLNRFHLSTYAMGIVRQPDLEAEYLETINALRALPVHVFIMQLTESEIEKRTAHPERSAAWEKFQKQIVKKQGFRNKVERYVWQQELMLDAAERQEIPYSVLRLPSATETGGGWIRVPNARTIVRRDMGIHSTAI